MAADRIESLGPIIIVVKMGFAGCGNLVFERGIDFKRESLSAHTTSAAGASSSTASPKHLGCKYSRGSEGC